MVGTKDKVTNPMTKRVRIFDPRIFRLLSVTSLRRFRTTKKISKRSRIILMLINAKRMTRWESEKGKSGRRILVSQIVSPTTTRKGIKIRRRSLFFRRCSFCSSDKRGTIDLSRKVFPWLINEIDYIPIRFKIPQRNKKQKEMEQ